MGVCAIVDILILILMADTTSARDELVGHATLAVLSLLGMGLYSGTYALVYASSSSGAEKTGVAVATLEFWMASVHLLSAVGCCACQALAMSMLQLTTAVPHVAEAQTTLFLGVAAAVTTLSLGCVGGESGVECAVYYGAAAVPRLASVGAVVWSLLLYASSLGCQAWWGGGGGEGGGGLSLGLRGGAGITATAVMGTVPWVIQGALVRTCGDAWRVHLCAAVRIQVDANVTTSTVTADCTHIDRSLTVSICGALVALLLAWCAAVPPTLTARKRHLLTGLGGGVSLVTVLIVWALQPTAGTTTTTNNNGVRAAPPPAFHIVCALFSGNTLGTSAWRLLTQRWRTSARAAAATTAATAAGRRGPTTPSPASASTSANLFAHFARPSSTSASLVLLDSTRHRGSVALRRLQD